MVQIAKESSLAPSSMRVIVCMYVAAIVVAELVVARVGVAPGALLHALILVALFNHVAFRGQEAHREILPILSLAPLLRLLSVTMPVREIPVLYWYVLIGVPLLIAAALTARLLGVSRASLGLRLPALWSQTLIALTGVPLGMAAFELGRPHPAIPVFNPLNLALAAGILFVFVGFVEELVFRGLLQRALVALFGGRGLLWSAALFMAMYAGSLSPVYILFMGLVGFLFGWCVYRTRSLWGVILAHGALATGMFCVWPFVLR